MGSFKGTWVAESFEGLGLYGGSMLANPLGESTITC